MLILWIVLLAISFCGAGMIIRDGVRELGGKGGTLFYLGILCFVFPYAFLALANFSDVSTRGDGYLCVLCICAGWLIILFFNRKMLEIGDDPLSPYELRNDDGFPLFATIGILLILMGSLALSLMMIFLYWISNFPDPLDRLIICFLTLFSVSNGWSLILYLTLFHRLKKERSKYNK